MFVVKNQEPPEIAPGPSPTITPEMIQDMLRVLESKGFVYFSEGGAYVPTEAGWKLMMNVNPEKEIITAYGDPKIIASDKKSFGVIKSKIIKTDKESVIGVKADKSCIDFNPEFKKNLQDNKKVTITIEAGDVEDVVNAYGSPALKLNSDNAIFVRNDDRIDGRVVAIMADKSASELKPELIEKLKEPETKIKITLEIKP